MKITGATAILQCLIHEGVDVVFGYPGGAIMPTYDAFYHFRDHIRHVLVRHEQGAAHAAEGYARVTGRPGVCIATSGPGATNLVTGIADAMLDSIPLVCITGQVHSALLGTDAFQETDVVGITMPITKWNCQVTRAEEIPSALAKAFYIATTGRPGPVVVDITKDAQVSMLEWEYSRLQEISTYKLPSPVEESEVEKAVALIDAARKPMILAGHGILIAKATQELTEFAERSGIPVATTLHGISAFPRAHDLAVGMLGMHGNYGPNKLTNQADLIIALGMRFDDRVTGNLERYATAAKVIHVDVDPVEIGKNVVVDVALVSDVREVLLEITPRVVKRRHDSWLEEFRKLDEIERQKVIEDEVHPTEGMIKMGEVVNCLSEASSGEAIVVADVGQHQMMAARYYNYKHPESYITSGGLGTMGFALPAAVGAKVGAPKRQVVAIIGDGGFQMNIQELATISQERLPVKIIILNNNFLGMVRQWQELFFDNRYSFVNLDNPDFVKIADGFGVKAKRVERREELGSAIQELLDSSESMLLDVCVEKEQNVFPMVPTGASVSDVRLE